MAAATSYCLKWVIQQDVHGCELAMIVAVVLHQCSVLAAPSEFTNLDSLPTLAGTFQLPPVVCISCQSSVSLCCSDPLGTEGMDPWWCPARDRLRKVAAVTPACFGTELEGLTCLWTPVWRESRMKRMEVEISREGLAGLKLNCRPPNQIVAWGPWLMQGAVQRVWPWQCCWSELWRADMGHHPRCSEGRAALLPTCYNLLTRSCWHHRCRLHRIQTLSPPRRTCRLLWQRRPRSGRNATVTTTRKKVQNESNAPPRLQMTSPGTDACIQDPGAGNYLHRRLHSKWLARNRKRGLAENIPLCLKQWYRRPGSLLGGKWLDIGSWESEFAKGTPASYW